MQNVATAVAVALAVAVSPHRQEATPDSASVVDWRRGGVGLESVSQLAGLAEHHHQHGPSVSWGSGAVAV